MMDSRAKADFEEFDQLVSERSQLDGLWSDIAMRIWPDYSVFSQGATQLPEGQRRTRELYDTTGAVALDRFSAAGVKYTAPSNRRYHKLGIKDDQLMRDHDVKVWMEYATNVLFRRRYAKQSGFGRQYFQGWKTLGAYGLIGTFTEEMPGAGNRYSALHWPDTYIMDDGWGRVNGLAIRCMWNAAQAAEKFGRDKLPDKLVKALDSNDAGMRNQKWEFVHLIVPEKRYTDASSVRGFRFVSRYSCREGMKVVQEGGFRSFPASIARFSTMPGEKYGRSPAMLVLPSLKMLNEIKKSFIRSGQKAVEPALLAFDDGVFSRIRNVPNGVTSGGLDEKGTPLVKPLMDVARLDWAKEALDDERRPINDVLLVTLFQILAEEPRVQTATEVVQRETEKATLLAPSVECIESDYWGPNVERELDLAVEAHDLPPMPPQLAERAGDIRVEFLSEFAQAQRADEVAGIMRAAETAPGFIALDPGAAKVVKWTQAYSRVVEGLGMPAEFINSPEEIEQMNEQSQQEQLAMTALQGAPAAAGAAKDFAQAEAIRRGQQAVTATPLSPA